MSNPGIINALNKEGIKTIEANVGDRNVIEKMNQYNASLGGENSVCFGGLSATLSLDWIGYGHGLDMDWTWIGGALC